MPRFWSEQFSFWDGEEQLDVKVEPRDFRRGKLLRLIPYLTGAKFEVDVEISAAKTSGIRALQVELTILEPDKSLHVLHRVENPNLPYTTTGRRRYLAIKGEYVVAVTLVSPDPDGKADTQVENRRLMTLETFSQDVFVANIIVAGITAVLGGVIGALITLAVR